MLPGENLENIASLLDKNPYPVFRVSSAGKMLYANNAGQCMLESGGCSIGGDVNPEMGAAVSEALSTDTIKKDIEIHCHEKAFSLTLIPVKRFDYVDIFGIEITGRKKAEKELENIQKKVIQRERLKAIGQMSSGIVHDINNSLFPILGFSEILIKNPQYLADKEKALSFLRNINTSAKHAANVIGRLKDFYRAPPSTMLFSPVDLTKLIKDIVGLTSPRWKDEMEAKGIVIKVETVFKDPLPAFVEESELRELIVNLVFNAVDAMPKGGIITISTWGEDGKAVVEIKDNGTGMPEDVKLHCFEPFFSTKGKQGTGLGLAMVYGTVKRYNGSIQIDSEEGKGTKFTIAFPSRLEKKVAQDQESVIKPKNLLKILIVDDNPFVREVVSEYLLFNKHSVETAESGVEAIEKLDKFAFDVVITDMAMPKMSGAELAILIRQKQKDITIILLTGFGEIMIAKDEKPEGVDFILEKPISGDKLMAAISGLGKKGKG